MKAKLKSIFGISVLTLLLTLTPVVVLAHEGDAPPVRTERRLVLLSLAGGDPSEGVAGEVVDIQIIRELHEHSGPRRIEGQIGRA